jgi:geranylgeranyl diphosphate synthase type I
MQQARATLDAFRERADARLEELFASWRRRALPGTARPAPGDLVEAVADLTRRGGKRLRPALAFHAACCFDHDLDEAALLDACLGVELLQTYLLIHDDVMDGDAERRGGPSVHVVLARLAGSDETGRSLAILAGDLACALSQELLLHPALPPERARAAAWELFRMQWEVIQGQLLDLVGGADPLDVHDAKTASYTTRGPVRLGAALAGAAQPQVAALERYGTPLGRAFQVRDDLLGTFGKQADLGKPVGSDLRAGKRTSLVRAALDRADAAQRAAILDVLGRPGATDAQIASACSAIEATGARQHEEALIESLTAEALAALDTADGLREVGRAFLRGVALLLADRDR